MNTAVTESLSFLKRNDELMFPSGYNANALQRQINARLKRQNNEQRHI